MPKPTILLGPGSFALPEFYDPVMEPVATKGYEIRGLHLPSVSVKSETRDGGPPTMYDDAAFIATAIAKIADGGKDVVLIAHSYGGVPATESTKGLGKQERQNQGKKGGVVNIAYMTAIVPAIRTAAMSVLADVPPDQQLNLKIDVGVCFLCFWFHLTKRRNRKEAGWLMTMSPNRLQFRSLTFPKRKAKHGSGGLLIIPRLPLPTK